MSNETLFQEGYRKAEDNIQELIFQIRLKRVIRKAPKIVRELRQYKDDEFLAGSIKFFEEFMKRWHSDC